MLGFRMSLSQPKIRLILVDDHSSIHLEVGELLKLLDDVELVAQASNGMEAVKLCDQHQPDIVLMDIVMPIMDGIEATREILARYPQIKILAMSGLDEPAAVQAIIDAGAVGYLLKEAHPKEFVSTIRAVASGKAVFSAEVMTALFRRQTDTTKPPDYGLTRREVEILSYLVDGKGNMEIAQALTISPTTVKFHVSNILHKLNVTNRAAAIALASKQGLVR
jgi:two-component system, NarL family, response regulator LiaR